MKHYMEVIDGATGEVVRQEVPSTLPQYPTRFRDANPAIPTIVDRRMQGAVLRAEGMRVLAELAPQQMRDAGQIAISKQLSGQRVYVRSEAHVTSERPGGCFSGPSTPVSLRLVVTIND